MSSASINSISLSTTNVIVFHLTASQIDNDRSKSKLGTFFLLFLLLCRTPGGVALLFSFSLRNGRRASHWSVARLLRKEIFVCQHLKKKKKKPTDDCHRSGGGAAHLRALCLRSVGYVSIKVFLHSARPVLSSTHTEISCSYCLFRRLQCRPTWWPTTKETNW